MKRDELDALVAQAKGDKLVDELARELRWRQNGGPPCMVALATEEITRILRALANEKPDEA